MTSQQDLDQGGTFRGWNRQFLGPSVGWIPVPGDNIFPITAGGTYKINLSTSLVTVSVAAGGGGNQVTITLPSTIPTAVAGAVPGQFALNPIVIVDIGGFASANPIVINPASGAETIMGLTTISLNANFGGYTLLPVQSLKGWSSISP